MLRGFALLERSEVERLGVAAFLAFDQSLTTILNDDAPCLLALDKVTDRLAIVWVAACLDLIGNPCILLFGYRNGLANGSHSELRSVHTIGAI